MSIKSFYFMVCVYAYILLVFVQIYTSAHIFVFDTWYISNLLLMMTVLKNNQVLL